MSQSSGLRAPGKQLAGAASKSYNVAAIWEKTAALSESQLRAVEALGQSCAQRPLPSHVVDDVRSTAVEAPLDQAHAKDSYVGTLEDAVLHNTSQFHKWHSELEAACASETEEKYKRYADLLSSHVGSCETILGKVDLTLEAFDSLLSQHRDVAGRSRALHASCEQLVREKEALVEFADALRAKLRFFDEFETVYAQFNAAQLSLDADQFLTLLRKLDDCMAYVANNPQYADAGQYSAKFRQLQGRALGAVRSKVQQVLRAAVQQVQAAIQQAAAGGGGAAAGASTNGGAPSPTGAAPAAPGAGAAPSAPGAVPQLAEGAEVPMLYVRFRAAAEPNIKGLLREVEARAGRPEYARLLAECHNLYAQARLALISPYVQQRIAQYAAQPLPLFTRNGCEHLGRVCQLEVQLFEHFFPGQAQAQQDSAKPAGPTPGAKGSKPGAPGGPQASAPAPALPSSAEALAPLLEPLATLLYDQLRPAVVVMQDLDELCELVDILKHEVLGEQLARRGVGGEALKPLLGRCLADVQGRLIFRVQAYIRDEISSYSVAPDDVDYPAKLLEQAAAAAREQDAQPSSSPSGDDNGQPDGDAAGSANGTSSAAAGASASAGGASADPYVSLFPPLKATLLVLSKLYRAVDSKIFGGLAQEAVSACTVAVQNASRLIAKKAAAPAPASGPAAAAAAAAAAAGGGGSATTPLDAQLFMIRNLLFLREQIVPFDVDFAVTDIDLDFSHMREHLRRIMVGQESLFTLGPSNAMVRMLGASGPRVLTFQLDSKKELEKALKSVCEALIMALTKVAVEPMLSFITKVTAVRLASGHGGAPAKPMREQAFASVPKLAEVVGRVNAALGPGGPLPAAVGKMRLYLPNPATHAILLKPVKSNIAEAHGQVAKLLQSDYTPEEAAEVPLYNPQQLAAVLEQL
ncbi:hypothetical protein HYH03_007071 [Edaphochlamys debaryana]|uniref:Conserved oligomeric Golgi complex subunit 3 n=1 Tax=Edaphochlamys debaryana TaxID=47281 RepID=A0A836BZM8_9CHLO|nr:hypothetical protein HYH03_007071 [Edaphochlamys debaryana]|eukprot:KAG2494830.1 hypothetical protein HYH03_007071 [Edaphochlamys debaryana]